MDGPGGARERTSQKEIMEAFEAHYDAVFCAAEQEGGDAESQLRAARESAPYSEAENSKTIPDGPKRSFLLTCS